ncbi:SRPBCC family protein [Galbitalea sp. SE-J8]|uniref:SRPBCC family protein n=1 Tax=Galbitalea sp. SE-J8 TaxID=3054952 RepID=UPI00259D300B|nr:SRPBCC family protein [Galbitalea sp. SE-J8]MDM4762169.1 SRPBCC family protein [Galbitalea sp. SE-J8]
MAVVVREIACPPERIFRVLQNGWLFTTWVVGASRMRNVDDAWPAVGSELHHSFGSWPFVIDDVTTTLEWHPPRRAIFQAKGWPVGEARVQLDVKPRGDGCVARLEEHAAKGPGAFVPGALLDIGLVPRNRESLRRLAHLAEGGAE